MENALNELNGVTSVNVDLDESSVTVSYEAAKASSKDIKEAINEAGYEVIG